MEIKEAADSDGQLGRFVYDSMRRFQHFKTLFCGRLILSNMLICYPGEK